MHKIRQVSVLLAVALFMAPTGLSQETTLNNPEESTPTTLYFHIFDTFNKFLINTQPMDAEFFDVGGNNFPTIVGTPANDAYGSDFDLNTIYGYSTAGPVEYEFIENGRPRFHPERGIAANVIIDENVQPTIFLYLDVRDFSGGDQAPNYLPSFTVRALVQEGDDPGVGARLDEGKDILNGQVTFDLATADVILNPYQFWCDDFWGCTPDPDDPNYTLEPLENPPVPDEDIPVVAGNDQIHGQTNPATGNVIYAANSDGIVEVEVPLDLATGGKWVLPKDEAFNIRIDWYQEVEGAAEEDQFAEPYFRIVASPDYLPRMELAIMNPVYLSFIHPQVASNTLLIHAGANSPWGTYDLDAESVTLTIDGPQKPDNLKFIAATNEHVHGLHDEDAQFTYLWEFREEGAPDGEYTISMSVGNDAATAVATGEAKFIIEGDKATGIDTEGNVVAPSNQDEVDTPAAGTVALLALLGAALVVARRRMNQ